ncbi:MAG TPA: hypothetical protein VJT67_18010, partial [Longimicrobiaceae bacterium]|nr:hypothetical protein [Longimicrobiaceae bacterium]
FMRTRQPRQAISLSNLSHGGAHRRAKKSKHAICRVFLRVETHVMQTLTDDCGGPGVDSPTASASVCRRAPASPVKLRPILRHAWHGCGTCALLAARRKR